MLAHVLLRRYGNGDIHLCTVLQKRMRLKVQVTIDGEHRSFLEALASDLIMPVTAAATMSQGSS